jgi:PAS domain S-box-containing protein
MKVPVENKILAAFVATALALAAMGWLSYRSTSDLISAQKWVTHTYEVISQLETTLALVIETDTEQRGYLLTGDPKLLATRQTTLTRIPAQLQLLQQLTADNPTEQEALKRLQTQVQTQISLTDDRIAAFQKSGLQAALAKQPMEKTEVAMNDIRALTTKMRSTEERLLAERTEQARVTARQTEVIVIAGSVFTIIIGLTAVFLVRRDLRLRARAEMKLHQTEERFRSMIAAVKDYSIVLLDPDGRIASWNRGAERLNGYTTEEIIGQKFSKFYPPETVAKGLPQQLLKEAAEQGRVEHSEWHVRKDDSQFWANIVITAACDATGKLLGFVKVTRDLTEQRKSQVEIEKLNADLLQHANQLEAANKELEAFSYSVSHDLRAPLRHIDGFVKMLSNHAGEKLDDRGRRYLDIIADSARRMGALIDDLLVFSRMSRAELHHSKVSTDALVHEAVDGLQIDINERHINWNIGALPEVDGDPAMLQQVWVNLISNAVKYTRPRDPAEIEIGYTGSGNGEHIFFVHDNGVGFDMQYAHKLFGVFQRLHRSEEFEGTGIGLANVSRIVHRHGGRVWAEGKPDVGATFYFSLPKKTTETRDQKE